MCWDSSYEHFQQTYLGVRVVTYGLAVKHWSERVHGLEVMDAS
jgi:hypothetical protein